MEKIKYQIELDRVLDVLSKEIYDSPYALLRENVQNAYDAILMRSQYLGKWSSHESGIIDIIIENDTIIISDNGIGMSEAILKNHYWKAGASGKKTELARKSGVIGTFGIGAMANFGVCIQLKVVTESLETKERIISTVKRDDLSLTKDCITIEKIAPQGIYGTTIYLTLSKESLLSPEQAKNYLVPFVQYLPIKVKLNGAAISQNALEEKYRDEIATLQKKWENFVYGDITADVLIQCNDNARVSAKIDNISIVGEKIEGVIYLRQDAGQIWGLRNFFGLAAVPISLKYSLGGIVNLSVLTPTAGREALTRDSVELITKIVEFVEECITNTLAESDLCNKSNAFMNHILNTGKLERAGKLVIRAEPDYPITLGELKDRSQNRIYNYYEGYDESLIKSYGTPDSILIVLSRSYPRRRVEDEFIKRYCKVNLITDSPKVIETYSLDSYGFDETSFILGLKYILKEDYAVTNLDVLLAKLTHNLPLYVQNIDNQLLIYIQRNHSTVEQILKCYSSARDVFTGFLKDYARVYVYPRIKDWVPSSSKEGAEALQKILRQKRELFEIHAEDIGLTDFIAQLIEGNVKLKDIPLRLAAFKQSYAQIISPKNVGRIETEIPDLIESPVKPPIERETSETFQPTPPIIRNEVNTDKKLLIVNKKNDVLNNFEMFIAISDTAFREEYEFFAEPHKTRIMWGGRKIIYIFTHASEVLSLYYECELFEDIGSTMGASILPTTTIITNKKIYIPVPEKIKNFFIIEKDEIIKFYVQFETI